MNEDITHPATRLSWFRNWLSLSGLVIMTGSLFAFMLLFLLDLFEKGGNPYLGVLTWLVAPGFLGMGLVLLAAGFWIERRKAIERYGRVPPLHIDLTRARDRRIMGGFVVCTVAYLFVTAFGSYHTYHFTESTTFCGKACHTVMQPEMDTYLNGPHARVSCTECHIGPGAAWFVKAKLSGTYQVYATLMKQYPTPIETPIKNLRPARDTCEQCHWPEQHIGDSVRTYTYHLSDESNTVHSIRMLLKVGGADPRRGPAGGIHWHVGRENRIEYYASDEKRLTIPWVRMIDAEGKAIEFRSPDFKDPVDPAEIRVMDCIDCHNRPAHRYQSPNKAVNLAMEVGRIDPAIPSIKANTVEVLTQPYDSQREAMDQIEIKLKNLYPDDARIRSVISEAQQIYLRNFFPEMKANWKAYPEHIGHKDWPGCVRCHDDQHAATDGSGKTIQFQDCSGCHLILAQGSGEALDQLDLRGRPFQHPGEEIDAEFRCHDCHGE